MKHVPARLCCCIVLASLLGGCGTSPVHRPAAKLDPKPYLLHLPGIAGGFRMHDRYCHALKAGGFDAETGIYDWTGGRFPISALRQRERNLREADKVAAILARKHRAEPHRPLYLSAESGGTGIAVWALERLPDDVQVDAVVLVSPAMSPGYDLSPALARVRRKMLVFPSKSDRFVLGFGALLFGTMDRRYGRSAGLDGFNQPARADAAQYAKLEQYPYRGKMFWDYGNGGGHAWAMYPRFASAWLAPRLVRLARQAHDSPATRPASGAYASCK
jgi:alpha-beta hydrolase superfamily lysophospholipase